MNGTINTGEWEHYMNGIINTGEWEHYMNGIMNIGKNVLLAIHMVDNVLVYCYKL